MTGGLITPLHHSKRLEKQKRLEQDLQSFFVKFKLTVQRLNGIFLESLV